ncbi:MAG: MFS transporter [Deltaproteobacteria bacterium]|nr:MFS transporter [Deltaproteobacteria bacterium]
MSLEHHVPEAPLGWGRTFASLRHRNYRLWFFGQLTSLLGTWMQSTAQGYLVFELTRSPAYLGFVAFAAGLPTWFFMLYAGVIADRLPRRRILVWSQLAMMALSVVFAALTFAGRIEAWHVVGLAFLLGIANAFDAPARQSIVLDLVGRDDLTNAVALNSLQFNTATTLGPAAGGVLYDWVGPGWCFSLNALSFVAVIAALAMMRLPAHETPPRRKSTLGELVEGLRYVAANRTILVILVLVAMVTIFGIAYVTLLPAWSVKILHGDATTNGWLQSARGAGALLCALAIASLGRTRLRGRLLLSGALALPVALLLFAAVRSLPLAMLMLVAVGATLILCFNMANTLVQTLSDDAFRGRVMGVYTLTFFGSMPLGALLAGGLAERLGEPNTVALGAAALACGALVILATYPALRRVG